MNDVFYYVYSQGLLGVKTNDKSFKWIYGSNSPVTTMEEYESCLVKFDITFKKEKHLEQNKECDKNFQAFKWDSSNRKLYYRRKMPFNLEIGYDLKITDDTVYVNVGECYNKFVKNRVMNLHGIYYLLSDIANVILLQKGFLTLYASSVYSKKSERCVVNFAPPSTGKTVTAMKLCETSECMLLGEDIILTDGKKVYACPWTKSYRGKKGRALDSTGSLFRSEIPIDVELAKECNLTDITVLSFGEKKAEENSELILKLIPILNGYLFHYYSSPIVKVLSYFDEEYDKPWEKMSNTLICDMVSRSKCYLVQAKTSEEFADVVKEKIIGKSNENFSYIKKCLG